VFLENELFWCNEPAHNTERPTEIFERGFGRKAGTRVVDIAPGFVVENGEVLCRSTREPLSADAVRRAYGDAIRQVNRIAPIGIETVRELKEMITRNVGRGAGYFASYEGDYTCLLQLKGALAGIRVVKAGAEVNVEVVETAESDRDYDVVYRTRASYMRQSLATQYGHETLFVGSGGIFEFRDRSRVRLDIHRELMAMLKPVEIGDLRRPADQSGVVGSAKRVLKRLLNISGGDLYDLEKWTVFERSNGT
jgi:hypothetical protein